MNIINRLENIIKKKKIFIFGYGTMGGTAHFTLHRLGYHIEGIVDSDEAKQGKFVGGTPIISPYDLLYYDTNEVVVFVCSDRSKEEVIDILKSLGYTEDVNFSLFFLEGRCEPFGYINPQVGWCRGNGQFVSYGSDVAKKTILTLGGSTTDYSLNGFKTWPNFLQNMLDSFRLPGGGFRVINGGAAGYCSSHEVLSFIVYGLKKIPDILITYSGYNDSAGCMSYEYNDYHALKTYHDMSMLIGKNSGKIAFFFGNEIEDYTELWLKNARILHGICNEFGIKHIHILQPCLIIMDCLDDVEQDICINGPYERIYNNVNHFYKEALLKIVEYSWIYDFSTIFKDSKIFLDTCHVNELGNEIIALEVYKILQKFLSEEVIGK